MDFFDNQSIVHILFAGTGIVLTLSILIIGISLMIYYGITLNRRNR